MNEIQIAVGKYTNSYKACLGEYASDGFTYRIGEQVDETCFERAYVFDGPVPALTKLVEVLECMKEAEPGNEAADFASALSNAVLHAVTNAPTF